MPRTRPPYPQEFRERIVELARAGRSATELAEEFEPCYGTIRSWIKQADLDEGQRSDGTTTAEREEIRQLRKELRRLRQERDILAKATAWVESLNLCRSRGCVEKAIAFCQVTS